jgi:hypothetical protein
MTQHPRKLPVQRIYFFGSSVKSVKTDDFAAREIIVFSHFRLMSDFF